MKFIVASIFILFLFSCSSNSDESAESLSDLMEQADDYVEIDKNGLEIEGQTLSDLQHMLEKDCESLDLSITEWSKGTDYTDTLLNTGVIFKGVIDYLATAAFDRYIDEMKENGNYIFLTHFDLDDEGNTLYDVVIMPCEDQFALIDVMGVDGLNHDIYNQDILNQMKAWDELVGFQVIIVDHDELDAYMDHLPDDVSAFAKEVYDFCPDVIDQGYGDMESLVEGLESKYFWLWWD